MMEGLLSITQKLCREGNLDGMMSLGGSGGTTIASYAMQNLPLGIPKIIVGTMASGNTVPYVQGQDILLINSVADIQSINFLTEYILGQAAAVMCAMIDGPKIARHKKKAIGITGFGVTTPCVQRCKELLEEMGYEIVIFHARGVSGGKIMEKMIRERFFAGVLDITTTELADEVGGGAYAIGPERLRGGVETNIPYIVVPGALEMINIGPEEQLRPEQADKVRYLSQSEPSQNSCRQAGHAGAGRALRPQARDAAGNTRLVIPTQGFSEIDKAGNVFYDPETDAVFTSEVKAKMPPAGPCHDKGLPSQRPRLRRTACAGAHPHDRLGRGPQGRGARLTPPRSRNCKEIYQCKERKSTATPSSKTCAPRSPRPPDHRERRGRRLIGRIVDRAGST